MLILTRRVGETICIGDDIEVTVLDVRGNYITLGTSAPIKTRIIRSELLLRSKVRTKPKKANK